MSIFPLRFPSVALIWEFPLNHAGGSLRLFLISFIAGVPELFVFAATYTQFPSQAILHL